VPKVEIRNLIRYSCSNRRIEDMELITELKGSNFAIKEISGVLSIKRLSNFSDENSIQYYCSLLAEKKQR
jgi:hypothetical protein